jgi:hypothetical protein
MVRQFSVAAVLVASFAVAACGSDGAAGPAGPKGDPGPNASNDPSVSGVVPSRAFLARKADVTISGFGTRWDATTKVDFGQGVVVDKVTVASPTAIVASISIDKGAATGDRDVSIDGGGAKVVYKGAFKIESPVSVSTRGNVAQGSIFVGAAKGKDLSTPFDTTTQGGGLFGPPEFVGVKIADIPGITPQVSNVTLYGVDFSMAVDVTAPTGQRPFSIVSGLAPDQIEFPLPEGLTIAARAPVVLASGTPVQGRINSPFESVLYQVTPPAGLSVVDLRTNAAASGSRPMLVVLPKSGKFADFISSGPNNLVISTAADALYGILWDSSGTAGYQATVGAVVTPASGAAEAANNDTCAAAQVAASLPFVLQSATLSSSTDEDWVRITAAAGDVGKRIRVRTVGGDPQTDTVVEVFQSNGTTTLGGPSNDQDYHENHLSAVIPSAADYCVKISASSTFSATANTYQALIRIE